MLNNLIKYFHISYPIKNSSCLAEIKISLLVLKFGLWNKKKERGLQNLSVEIKIQDKMDE